MITFIIVLVCIILLIGIVRVICSPYKDFVTFIMEMMLIDWMTDMLDYLIELLDHDD